MTLHGSCRFTNRTVAFFLPYFALIASIDGATALVLAHCFRRLLEVKVLATAAEGPFLRQERHSHGEMEDESKLTLLGQVILDTQCCQRLPSRIE